MKQGTNFLMPVTFEGADFSEIEKIEFIFKNRQHPKFKPFKTAVYPDDASVVDDIVYIPWTADETYLVTAGSHFYMDTRIHLKDSLENPETEVTELTMGYTLFNKDEDVINGNTSVVIKDESNIATVPEIKSFLGD